MENIIEEIDETVKIKKADEPYLVSDIVQKWDDWDDQYNNIKELNKEISKYTYPTALNKTQKDLQTPELYEIKEAYKAHLWRTWFNTYDAMFDVQGKNEQDQEQANIQKSALIDIFRKIKLEDKLEKSIVNYLDKGEVIVFVGWEQKTKEIRRKEQVETISIDKNGMPVIKTEEKFVTKEVPFYNGPSVKIINSESFVFDKNKIDDFDSCPKIYKSWSTYEQIKSNELYEIDKETDDFLKKASTEDKGDNQTTDYHDSSYESDEAFKGDQIEILEYWGDIRLKDGTYLRNWLIVVAGRKGIIRFESNPYIINPFIFATFLEDPETKRGISPLYVGLDLQKASNAVNNILLTALGLIVNKPFLAPKGALSGKIEIKEGGIIEYDPALMPKEPIPLDFKDALIGWQYLDFYSKKIESATGITKYMSGDVSGGKVDFATEAKGLMAGANIRLLKDIDYLNFKVKVPLIERIAELSANFNYDKETIRNDKFGGQMEFVMIDEIVRQGQYEYIIGDNKQREERIQDVQELQKVLEALAQRPEIGNNIKWMEIFKWTLTQFGSVDPNLFIKTPEEKQVSEQYNEQ